MVFNAKCVEKRHASTPCKLTYWLIVLVEESKMSTMQRDKLKYFLRNGEPLTTTRSTGKLSSRKTPPVLIRPGSPRRRTRDTIVKMGAYEREKFVPQPIVDREEAKRRLQDLLAFGKDGEPNTQKVRNKKKEKKDDDFCNNRFEECKFNIFYSILFHSIATFETNLL